MLTESEIELKASKTKKKVYTKQKKLVLEIFEAIRKRGERDLNERVSERRKLITVHWQQQWGKAFKTPEGIRTNEIERRKTIRKIINVSHQHHNHHPDAFNSP